jgi:protein involved in polysaccharide export with SLBB domain
MAARKPPVSPVPGVTFYDLRPGDRVRVTISGVTGVIDRRCKNRRDGWIVRWDEPRFGVTEGRVAWPNLEPVEVSDG